MKTLFLPIEKSKWNRNLCTKICKCLKRKEKKRNVIQKKDGKKHDYQNVEILEISKLIRNIKDGHKSERMKDSSINIWEIKKLSINVHTYEPTLTT